MDSPTVSTAGYDAPEGAFLRLKPSIDIATKYTGTARILAQALRDYGACIIDNSGRPKLYAEYGGTAGWGPIDMGSAATQIAMSDLEVIDWAPGVAPPATPPIAGGTMPLTYVKVIGRFGLIVGDGGDGDDDPDTQWCNSGTIRFTPLNTYTKVLSGGKWTAGNSVIEAQVGPDGYLVYNSPSATTQFVKLVDFTGDAVNPRVGSGKATHRIEFVNVMSGTTKVQFEAVNARLAADMVDPETGAVDLYDVVPVPAAGGTPIIVGPAGPAGKSVELQKSASAIQWRQEGGTFADLVPLADITGPAGGGGAAYTAGSGIAIASNTISLASSTATAVSGAVQTIAAGSGVTVSRTGATVTVNATGGGGGVTFTPITQAAYDALGSPDPSTNYLITD